MSTLNFNVNGDPRGDQPTVEADSMGGVPLKSHFEGDPINRFVATVPPDVTGGASLFYAGHTKQIRVILPPGDGSWEANQPPCRPPEQPDPAQMALTYNPALSRLTTSGRDFLLNGQRWIWRGSSDFRALQWTIEGRDLTGVFAQRVAAGANILRVFGMYNGGIGVFQPDSYGENYWGGLSVLCANAAKAGLFVELTTFADCQTFMPEARQHDYWNRLTGEAQNYPNLLVELANEYKKNGVDPSKFSSIPNVLCSRGSGLSDEAGFTPGWNYHTWHGRRDWPKVLFSAEDGWYVGEGWGPSGKQEFPTIPVVSDEPIGFADVDQAGRRSADPYVARVVAGTSAQYGAGGTFHSDYGIQSALWSPHVEMLAKEFYAALR